MSSAINQSFIEKHKLPTQKINVPIPVYNADGTRNAGRDITEYVETCMMIRGHVECIDLAVTNLGKKDIYLGHDWLKHHNPSVNWKMQSILFGQCSCAGNTFSLPDSDPDDKWDEELEEGDTILTVQMDEELVIRSVHHANKLAAAANADKPKRTFEEMVPEDYHSFRDLFSKESFDELPEQKPLGPRHRADSQHEIDARLQGLSLEPKRTGATRCVPRRELGVRAHPSLQITVHLSFLLCQKEGWHITSGTGLPKAERDDN